MTSKMELLQKHVGGNVAESLGHRNGEVAVSVPAVADSKKYNGRTHRRDAGDMAVSNIIPDPSQPRKEFDPESIERLARSMKDHGQLQAIRVRWSGELGKWIILAGERRYRAAVHAGLATIQCIFVEGELTEADILEEQLVENCLREDLKPIEQAHAFQTLMEVKGWSAKELAGHIHVHPSSVTQALALLNLPTDIKEKVAEGKLAPSVAYEVTKLESEEEQREVVGEVIEDKLSLKQAREKVRQKRDEGSASKPQPRSTTMTYKTPKRWTVVITATKKQVSKLEVAAELEGLAAQLRSKTKSAGAA
jgi:ParB family chromosome partitioning protein